MNIKRYDNTEFRILKACGGLYITNSPYKERALLMMQDGILKNNPFENWKVSGWRFTQKGLEYYDAFMQKVRDSHGHIWELNDYNNEINEFAYESSHCNGPRCINCGFSFCQHCTDEMNIPKCEHKK
jgi:hypothetical protein